MDFKKAISKFSAAELSAKLGCPVRTAYNWLDGTRTPPKWLQSILLDWLKRKG